MPAVPRALPAMLPDCAAVLTKRMGADILARVERRWPRRRHEHLATEDAQAQLKLVAEDLIATLAEQRSKDDRNVAVTALRKRLTFVQALIQHCNVQLDPTPPPWGQVGAPSYLKLIELQGYGRSSTRVLRRGIISAALHHR
jgi:hypothetical protein